MPVSTKVAHEGGVLTLAEMVGPDAGRNVCAISATGVDRERGVVSLRLDHNQLRSYISGLMEILEAAEAAQAAKKAEADIAAGKPDFPGLLSMLMKMGPPVAGLGGGRFSTVDELDAEQVRQQAAQDARSATQG
jgi:hypothetical protein